MRISAQTIDVMDKIDAGSYSNDGGSDADGINIPRAASLDRWLIFIKELLEHIFGMHIGFAVGWLSGWCAGKIYADLYEPLFFSGLSEFNQWRLIPCEFAEYGATLGLIGGAILVMLLTRKSLRHNGDIIRED